jgi:hypothetical protein
VREAGEGDQAREPEAGKRRPRLPDADPRHRVRDPLPRFKRFGRSAGGGGVPGVA